MAYRLFSTDQLGNIVGEVQYTSLEVGFNLDSPAYINCEIDKFRSGTPLVLLEPYRYDFALTSQEFNLPNTTAWLIGGMWTTLDLDLFSETARLSGQDWWHYLERRTWNGLDGSPTPYAVTSRFVKLIIRDLIDVAATAGVNYGTGGIASSGITANYRIEPGDSESLASKIRGLLEQYGYDMKIDAAKTVYIEDGASGFPQAVWADFMGENIIGTTVTYSGPMATDVVSLGAGLATNTRLYKYSGDSTVRTSYRRHDAIVDIGSISHQASVDAHNVRELIRQKAVMKDIRVTKYGTSANLWVPVGDKVKLQFSTGFETIDTDYRVVSAVHRISGDKETTESTYQLDLASLY